MLFGHGDDSYKSKQKVTSNYSSNVWYGADLTPLKAHLTKVFDSMSSYPEPDAGTLRRLLAEVHGVSSSEILVTNGSITAFYLIAQAWEQAHSLIFTPSFAEYEDACRLHHHTLSFFQNTQPLTDLTLEGQDMCWICNPNNPDGQLFTREQLVKLLENNPQTLFVIDQVYADFCVEHLLDLADVHAYPNLIIVQSISKLHRIPGIRIGYVAAPEALIAKIQEYLIPWSVNAFAIEAGKYTLMHPEQFILPLEQWLADAELLRQHLSELGINVYPSAVPFFLNRLPQGLKAADLKHYLWENNGILIRDASNFRGLDETCFRLSAQTSADNRRLVEAIGRYISVK